MTYIVDFTQIVVHIQWCSTMMCAYGTLSLHTSLNLRVWMIAIIYNAKLTNYSLIAVLPTGTSTEAVGKMRNCGMRKVKCGIKNAEWRWLARRQTTWPLAFRRLPHQSLNRQCSKMQTRSAEKLSNGGRPVFRPWIHFVLYTYSI